MYFETYTFMCRNLFVAKSFNVVFFIFVFYTTCDTVGIKLVRRRKA